MFQVIFPAVCALIGVIAGSVLAWFFQRRATKFRARLEAYSDVMTRFVLWHSRRDAPGMESAIAAVERARLLASPITDTALLDLENAIAGEASGPDVTAQLCELRSLFRNELKKI